ncbi:diguanylate cyclase [Desulfobacterales bacterium HSG17]|nr:diguanylate cyclase [Desulfobacterales bacterium HSG17]
MKKEKDNLFDKEQKILKQGESFIKQGDTDHVLFLEQYTRLLKSYKKLLRQTKTLTRVSDNQQQKLNKILERLGRYLSYQLVKKITYEKEESEIKTHRKKLTVFFSDLKDFSYISSHMEGEALSEFLNSYLEVMTQIITKWGGTLDKYIGDAIMVFFGDPEFTSDEDHAFRCVNMAMEMREKMKGMRKKWYDMGYQEPLHCRMGIATGYCTVGNFGSSERMDYTIIGTPVNLAARLESAAELDEIFISHETWGYIKEQINCDPPLSLKLKGFHHPILAHKVLSSKSENNENLFYINDEIKGENIEVDFSTASREELISIIKMQESSRYSATHDPLTGFLNREAVLERLKIEITRAEREDSSLSIALIGLDKFDQINRSHGFNFGNEILCKCAERIKSSVRHYDIAGRFALDQMLIIIPGSTHSTAQSVFKRISNCLAFPKIEIRNISISVTASFGCVTFDGIISLDGLIISVEEALEGAKKKGVNSIEFVGFD